MTHHDVQNALRQLADKEIAEHSGRFFKTGKGEYGAGDRFLGVRVPVQRKIARRFQRLPIPEVTKLLVSPYHEDRLTALFILVHHFEKGDEAVQRTIYTLYLDHTEFINNWDLVDSSAHKIVGPYLEKRDRALLYDLAGSDSVWQRRIALVSCMHFIRQDDFKDALALAELLIGDEHDLVHKAAGWMLREIGKRDRAAEKRFLDRWCRKMPRTMLRYAIEKFPESERTRYLAQ